MGQIYFIFLIKSDFICHLNVLENKFTVGYVMKSKKGKCFTSLSLILNIFLDLIFPYKNFIKIFVFVRIDIFIKSISYSFKTMVVGSIEERIKKMKEAIQN